MSGEVTIAEAKEIKRNCEHEVRALLTDFQEKTGLNVSYVELNTSEMSDGTNQILRVKFKTVI